jgi:ABC-type cobalamin transport system ATPase subunit
MSDGIIPFAVDDSGERSLTISEFEVVRGSGIGIIGPSGSGKSLLIAALMRLAPFSGSYRIDGRVVDDTGEIPRMAVVSAATFRAIASPCSWRVWAWSTSFVNSMKNPGRTAASFPPARKLEFD